MTEINAFNIPECLGRVKRYFRTFFHDAKEAIPAAEEGFPAFTIEVSHAIMVPERWERTGRIYLLFVVCIYFAIRNGASRAAKIYIAILKTYVT